MGIARITFSDGTAVYLEVDEVSSGGGGGAAVNGAAGAASAGPTLPEGLGATTAVGLEQIIEKTGAALTSGLKSLTSVMEAVHDAVSASARRPDELSVQLGFKMDGKLDLWLVKGHSEANFVVTAKWNLAAGTDEGS